MKAIVHIGTEKTGTQSIQKCLYKNRRKLQKAGYHFIQSAGKMNHQAIPSLCMRDEAADDFIRRNGLDTLEKRNAFRKKVTGEFSRELSKLPPHVHTVLISSEHFHSRIRTRKEMDNVHCFLTQFFDDIRIVCYLREQSGACSSYYSTSLKSGGTSSFAEFVHRCRPDNYYYNHQVILENWERCFGFEALDVSLFNRARFVNGDLLQDFIAKIDPALNGSLDISMGIENESLTPAGLSLIRAINLVFPASTARPEVLPVLNKCRSLIDSRLKGKGQQLSLQKRMEIYNDFRQSNENVRQKFFPDVDVTFAPPTVVEPVGVEITEAFLETHAAVLDMLTRSRRAAITEAELAEFDLAVSNSWAELDSAEARRGNEEGDPVLESRDPLILRHATSGYQRRHSLTSSRLRSLARKIESSLPRLRDKLGKFKREK